MYPPSRIKVLLRPAGVRYVHAQGRGALDPVRSHGAAERAVDDPRRGRGAGRTRGPRLVATTIQVHFVNVKAWERAIGEFMAVRFRWPGARTRRRVAHVVELGG